jgi:hypothetical protein
MNKNQPKIEVNETGVVLLGSRMDWKDVVKAHAYKIDVFTTDLICVAFFSDNDVSLEIREDMQGWQEICDLLPKFLPGCLTFKEWFPLVSQPAFAPSETEIFSRK